MRIFRLCRSPFITLDGEGAKLYGGRWNFRGYPMVYTSAQLSLAILELLVHTDADLIPDNLMQLEIEVPANISRQSIELPQSFLESNDNNILQEIGTQWLKEQSSAILCVPSIIVPIETNILINPLHKEAHKIQIIHQQLFTLDPRLL